MMIMPSQMGLSLGMIIYLRLHLLQELKTKEITKKIENKYKGNTYSSIFLVHHCWIERPPQSPPGGGPHGGLQESVFRSFPKK